MARQLRFLFHSEWERIPHPEELYPLDVWLLGHVGPQLIYWREGDDAATMWIHTPGFETTLAYTVWVRDLDYGEGIWDDVDWRRSGTMVVPPCAQCFTNVVHFSFWSTVCFGSNSVDRLLLLCYLCCVLNARLSKTMLLIRCLFLCGMRKGVIKSIGDDFN